jgi:hypothetical protein
MSNIFRGLQLCQPHKARALGPPNHCFMGDMGLERRRLATVCEVVDRT